MTPAVTIAPGQVWTPNPLANASPRLVMSVFTDVPGAEWLQWRDRAATDDTRFGQSVQAFRRWIKRYKCEVTA